MLNGVRRLHSAFHWCLVSRGLLFSQPEMEMQFTAAERRFTVSVAYFWIALTALLLSVGFLVRCNKYGWFENPDLLFFLYFIPFGVLFLKFAAVCVPQLKAHTYHLLCLAHLGLIAWIACSVHLNVMEDRDIVEATVLPEVFAALQQNVKARVMLHRYIGIEMGRKYLWYALVINFCHLDLLQFLGITWASTLVFISVPLSLYIVSYMSPLLAGSILEVLVMSVIIILYTMGLSYYMMLNRRRKFDLDYRLQRTLEKEAEALREAAQQEAALKEAAQQADSILNHLLKNVMADAAGCIHLYLHSLPSNPTAQPVFPTSLVTPPPDLVQATECLERGVAWCRKRQALLRIASGQYTPQLCEVDLVQFGRGLLQGRPIEADIPEEVVTIDPLLCEIVLENALTNAHRHSHPSQPDLRFTSTLAPLPNPCGPLRQARRRLKFIVTNRAHPSHPPLTPEMVASLLRGEQRPQHSSPSHLSEHLGMQHLCQAARVHGMEVQLSQTGDMVHFEASLEVTLPPFGEPSPVLSKESFAVVPPNLRVLCIDDSAVARRLLVHTLSSPPMQATVIAFGETAEEMAQFLEEAVRGADIVILDYHLDYGLVSYLGTDLLRSLLERGFQGLVCMRSANASPFDEAVYMRAGAHCCIGKDVHPQAMASALIAAYLRKQVQSDVMHSCERSSVPALLQDDPLVPFEAAGLHCTVSLPGSPT